MATVRLGQPRFAVLALVSSIAAVTVACQGGPHALPGVPDAAAPQVRVGDWHYSTEVLVATHHFQERGRFVAVQIARIDDGEDGSSKRYREQAGFIDTHERRIHWWKQVDVPLAPILGGDAYAARVRCARCTSDERDQILVVFRSNAEIWRFSPPLRPGAAAATSAFALSVGASEAERQTGGRVLALSLSWATSEAEPTLVGYVPARGPR
jgi:hypothetical protein